MDFNLPHDMVKLPSGGHTYRPKKESLKVGYLTAMDENILMSQNTPKDGLIMTLLKNKIYEPGFDVGQLLEVDVQAILIFLRNTAFGPEYDYVITDPKTDTKFEAKLISSSHMSTIDDKKLVVAPFTIKSPLIINSISSLT
jgi:hypothetical protein